jgi:hypothetical protein
MFRRAIDGSENLLAGTLREVRRGIRRVGSRATTRIIFFVGHQWLIDTSAQQKPRNRNEKHEKNLHTRSYRCTKLATVASGKSPLRYRQSPKKNFPRWTTAAEAD